jgi:hypothetical protein
VADTFFTTLMGKNCANTRENTNNTKVTLRPAALRIIVDFPISPPNYTLSI